MTLSKWDREIIADYRSTLRKISAVTDGRQEDELVTPLIGDAAARPVSYWNARGREIARNIEWIENNPSGQDA